MLQNVVVLILQPIAGKVSDFAVIGRDLIRLESRLSLSSIHFCIIPLFKLPNYGDFACLSLHLGKLISHCYLKWRQLVWYSICPLMLGLTSYRLCTTVHPVVCRFMQFSAAAVKFLGSRFKAIGRLLGVCARCALLGAKINSSLACVVFTLFRIQFSAIWSWWLRYIHCILFFTHKVYSGVSKV